MNVRLLTGIFSLLLLTGLTQAHSAGSAGQSPGEIRSSRENKRQRPRPKLGHKVLSYVRDFFRHQGNHVRAGDQQQYRLVWDPPFEGEQALQGLFLKRMGRQRVKSFGGQGHQSRRRQVFPGYLPQLSGPLLPPLPDGPHQPMIPCPATPDKG